MKSTLLTALLFTAFCSTSHAQFFRDDFDVGLSDNRSPVIWAPLVGFDEGEREIAGGSFTITPPSTVTPGSLPGWSEHDEVVVDRVYSDVSIRLQARAPTSGNHCLGVFRVDDITGEADASLAGGVCGGGNVWIGAYDLETGTDLELIERLGSAFPDVVNLRFDIAGDTAQLFVWPEGDVMPSRPQVVMDPIPSYIPSEGAVGLFLGSQIPQQHTIAFEYFETAPVPEPSGLALLISAGLGALVLRHRKHFAYS